MLAVMFALQLLATTAASSSPMAHTPAVPGAPEFVQVGAIVGLPADSLVRGRFLAAFRGAFASSDVPVESRSESGAWSAAGVASNRFRWLEGDPADDTWTLELSLGVPPAVVVPARGDQPRRVLESHRRSRGMIAAVTVTWPRTDERGPRSASERVAFAFAASDSTGGSGGVGVPAIGYLYPWDEAGRAVARLAIETLLRQRGDLDERTRVAIAPASRAEAGR